MMARSMLSRQPFSIYIHVLLKSQCSNNASLYSAKYCAPLSVKSRRFSAKTAVENASEKNDKIQDGHHVDEDDGPQEFRRLYIPGVAVEKRKKRVIWKRREVPPPRYLAMKPDQDWTSVWPSATTFKYSAVPLPVRQGIVENMNQNQGVPPEKYANAELIKIPNFLHLTPKHIKKHCAAIKDLCTDWPEGLDDAACKENFPITVISSDYVFSASSIRDPRARVVKLKIKLSSLNLDYHARDKILRLLGDRYNNKTNTLTIESDRCPLKSQNEDYVKYLLTAVYYEACKTEAWEANKEEADFEKYFWDLAASRKNLVNLATKLREVAGKDLSDGTIPSYIRDLPDNFSEDELIGSDRVQEYKEATSELHNEGENTITLNKYKDSVVKLLHGASFS